MQLCQWAGRQVALPIKGTQGMEPMGVVEAPREARASGLDPGVEGSEKSSWRKWQGMGVGGVRGGGRTLQEGGRAE